MYSFLNPINASVLTLFFALLSNDASGQNSPVENNIRDSGGGSCAEKLQNLIDRNTELRTKLLYDSNRWDETEARLKRELNDVSISCTTKVELLLTDHANELGRLNRKLGNLESDNKWLRKEIDTCTSNLQNTQTELLAEQAARTGAEKQRDSLQTDLDKCKDDLENCEERLIDTQAECASESFTINGQYKRWGKTYQVVLNDNESEFPNPSPAKLQSVTITFNTCDNHFGGQIQYTLGSHSGEGNIDQGEFKAIINKGRNRGKKWFRKNQSYNFEITGSNLDEKQVERLKNCMQGASEIRF